MAAESSGSIVSVLPNPDRLLEDRREMFCREERQLLLAATACCAASGLAPDIVGRRADEAVAGNEMVIEERQRLVGGERGEPDRQPGELHGHRVEVHAKETA